MDLGRHERENSRFNRLGEGKPLPLVAVAMSNREQAFEAFNHVLFGREREKERERERIKISSKLPICVFH